MAGTKSTQDSNTLVAPNRGFQMALVQGQHDTLWEQAVKSVLDKLPAKDARWLRTGPNQQPFTSVQIFSAIQLMQKDCSQSLTQKFFAKLDPFISHVASFANAISVVAQANPAGAGVIWGSIYLLLMVAGRTQHVLESVLEFLWSLGPQLSLFSRWRQLFPGKDFGELGDSIHKVYVEVIEFCIETVRHLRRHYISKLLHTMIQPSLEADFRKREARIKQYTTHVRAEVDIAHMYTVKEQLATIGSLISTSTAHASLDHIRPLKSIRLIPHSQNHRFFGRQEILGRMRRDLLDLTSTSQQRFVLHGPGGSGKTQIALEYTYRQLDDYKVVIWILADSSEKIEQGFRDAAEMLGLDRTPQNVNLAKSFVLQRLSCTNDGFLLCFDNADDLSLIKDCFPRTNHGTIVITSRDAVAAGEIAAYNVRVPEFSVQEGSNFLGSLLSRSTSPRDEDEAILQQISAAFHGYPLALSQVAGFIRTGGCTASKFLTVFQDKKNSAAISSIKIDDYHATLATVWNLSFSSLDALSRQLLFILVYLDPDKVPYILFKEGSVTKEGVHTDLNLQEFTDEVKFWTALKGLRSQSLVRINPNMETVSIHRFLQDQAFKQLCDSPQHRQKAFKEALFLLTNMQPEFPNVYAHWSPQCWEKSEICLPHIKRLAARFMESPLSFKGLENKLGKIVYECASYEFETYHHQAASETFVLARDIVGMASSPNPLLLSDCYRIEGRMYNESGEPELAIASNQSANIFAEQAVTQNLISTNDSRLPRILTGLGNSLSQLDRFDEALELQLKAMKLCRNVSVKVSDAITIVQLNWGFLLYRRGDLDGAEQVLRAALEADPQTPPAMFPLGNTYLAQGKVDEAIVEHMKGLKIYLSMFGDQHATIGRCMYKIGEILLLHKRDINQAIAYLRRSLEVCKKQGTDYYKVRGGARGARMLAKALEQNGETGEASRYYEEAWSLREKIDGIRGSPSDTDDKYSRFMFYWDQ